MITDLSFEMEEHLYEKVIAYIRFGLYPESAGKTDKRLLRQLASSFWIEKRSVLSFAEERGKTPTGGQGNRERSGVNPEQEGINFASTPLFKKLLSVTGGRGF